MIPQYIREKLSKLSVSQQLKFHELLAWGTHTGLTGVSIVPDYDRFLEMAKRMGETPVEPKEPTISDDPDFVFKDHFKKFYKDSQSK